MSILKKLIESSSVDSNDVKDYSGVSFINTSGIYDLIVKRAWVIESQSGAIGIHCEYEGEGLFEQDVYMTNKEGQTFYNKNGKDMAMAGYVAMKKLNYVLTNQFLGSLSELHTETRLVKTTEWKEVEGEKKKVEVEKEVDFIPSWQGKPIKVGIQMKEKEEQVKQGDKYVGTGKVACDKDGKPYLEVDVIGYYNADTNQTANEMKSDKVAEQINKDKDRLDKSPVRLLKVSNKPTTASANGTSSNGVVKKPSIF